MSETQNALKEKISKYQRIINSSGGCAIFPDRQRVFHLGQELKTGKRSPSTLAIGKYGIYRIHLLPKQPSTLELCTDDDDCDDAVVVTSDRKSNAGGRKRSYVSVDMVINEPLQHVKGADKASDECNEDRQVVVVNSWEDAEIKLRQHEVVNVIKTKDKHVIELQSSDTDAVLEKFRIN